MGLNKRNGKRPPRLCCLNIDLDPLDHYFSVRGYEPNPGTRLNAVYEDALPRFLDLFGEYGVKATFFVVGRDLKRPDNRRMIRRAAEAGHEIANHTQNHIQTYGGLSPQEKREEIIECHHSIAEATGSEPKGFRAPGWSADIETMKILVEMGYEYDSSVFPSFLITPISYVNWFLNRRRVSRFLNQPLLGLAPKKPYRPSVECVWKRGGMNIVELPLSILPVVQLPFMGTILFLWGRPVFNLSLLWMRLYRRPLNYILHGIELVDYYREINDERLDSKPGIKYVLEDKVALYRFMITKFKPFSNFATLRELAFSQARQREEIDDSSGY